MTSSSLKDKKQFSEDHGPMKRRNEGGSNNLLKEIYFLLFQIGLCKMLNSDVLPVVKNGHSRTPVGQVVLKEHDQESEAFTQSYISQKPVGWKLFASVRRNPPRHSLQDLKY